MTDAASAEREAGPLPILDRPALATLAALLPPGDLLRNLATLVNACEDLRLRLGGFGSDAERAAAAHTLAGSGGLLGFARLSAAARRFERAIDTGAADRTAHTMALLVVLEATLPAMLAFVDGADRF